jgi:hypothetical protein
MSDDHWRRLAALVSACLLGAAACSSSDSPSHRPQDGAAGGAGGAGGAGAAAGGGTGGASGVGGWNAGGASAAGGAGAAGTSSTDGGSSVGGASGGRDAGGVIPACTDLDTPGASFSLQYYRLRIDYVSTTDWTGLQIADASNIIKARVMSQTGTPQSSSANFDRLSLNQALEAAQASQTVSIQADYALRPEALDAPFTLKLTKGVAGSVTVRVSSVVGANVQLLKSVDSKAPTDFSVDLSSLKGTAAWQAPMAPVRRMAWAVYYPWYSLSSWSSTDLKDKPSTPYSSDNPADIERQMDQAKTAGITGFISSWWGPGSGTDKNMPLILDAAKKKGFSIGIFLETMKDGGPLSEAELTTWITSYVAAYRDHPATMKVNGKPFIMPFVTCTVPLATWKNVFAQVRAKGLDATMVADCTDMTYLEAFDGAKGTGTDTGRAVRYYSVLADAPAAKIWMANANPGYDDRLLAGRPGSFIDREGGNRFRTELRDAMLTDPQWVRIETWNEYYENTYVEPSVAFGNLYTQIAGEYLNPWKCPDTADGGP